MKKYSKDYKLIAKTSKNGRITETVEYIGKYYVSRQNKTEQNRRKIYCLALSVSCIVVLIGAGFLNNPGSRVFYIAVPYACLFLPSIYNLMGAISFVRSGERLEYAAYDKSVKRIFRSTVGMIIINIIIILGDIFLLFSGLETSVLRNEIVFICCMALVLLLSIQHLRIQKKIVYEVEDTVVS